VGLANKTHLVLRVCAQGPMHDTVLTASLGLNPRYDGLTG